MDVRHRVEETIKYSGLSLRGFSIRCGISQPTLDKQIKGLRSVSLETIMSILFAYPEVSSEWLLRGDGEMLKLESGAKELERINKLLDTVTTLQDVINAKNGTIATLTERIKQLESQISK